MDDFDDSDFYGPLGELGNNAGQRQLGLEKELEFEER